MTRSARGFVALIVSALATALGAGVVHRYRSTIEVSPYDLADRSLHENAVEGARIGASIVQVGALRGLIRAPTTGHSWLVYWGGNTSTYFQESVDAVARLKLPSDVGVLIVAPPGYDGSPGHPSPEAVVAAALETLDWLVKEHRADRVVTGGFSMGTLSAVVAAQQKPVVVGVFLLASFTVFETGEPGRFIRFREPVRYVMPVDGPAPRVPSLVVHGALDDGFPIEMGRAVARWLGAEFVERPGVGHVALETDAQALERAGIFTIDRLGSAP